MPPTDRKGTLFGGDAVHVALILQTRATARRARNAEPASARDRGTIVRKHISGPLLAASHENLEDRANWRAPAGDRVLRISGSPLICKSTGKLCHE